MTATTLLTVTGIVVGALVAEYLVIKGPVGRSTIYTEMSTIGVVIGLVAFHLPVAIRWPRIFPVLPDLSGQTVLDAGCAFGDPTAVLVQCGAHVIGVGELSFRGPAKAEVLGAWNRRFNRMPLLTKICAPDYETVRNSIMQCRRSPAHRSLPEVDSCSGRLEPPRSLRLPTARSLPQ